MNNWLKVQMLDKKNSAEVWIDGEIGMNWWNDDGVNSKAFIQEVKALGDIDVIDLKINSPGGSVHDGLTIYNYLKQHKATVNVTVMAQAASIASVIAMAGDTVTMATGSIMMVHNPWTYAVGNANDLRKTADELDLLRDSLIEPYIAKTGMNKDDLVKLLDEETYMTSATAVELGFADASDAGLKAVASERVSIGDISLAVAHARHDAEMRSKEAEVAGIMDQLTQMRKERDELQEKWDLMNQPAASEFVVEQCKAADMSYLVGSMIERNLVSGAVKREIEMLKEFRALCKVMGADDRTVLEKSENVANMASVLINETLAAREQDLDTNLPVSGNDLAPKIDPVAIYTRFNNPSHK